MNLTRKIMVGNDARSARGIFSRGKTVYHGGTFSARLANRQNPNELMYPKRPPPVKPPAPNKSAVERKMKKGKSSGVIAI